MNWRILSALIVPIGLLALVEWTLSKVLLALPTWCWMVYIIIAALGYLGIVLAVVSLGQRPIKRSYVTNLLIGLGAISVVQKLVLIILLTLGGVVTYFITGVSISTLGTYFFIISMMIVIAMIYGITYGKYRYVTEDLTIHFDRLPKELDGLKVVQISDIHAGTWDSIDGVKKGIDLINAQEPDLILFTGDLVNTNKDEIDPFIDLFASLKAPYGKYAVLGNHDYYGQPRDRSLRPAYYQDLYQKYIDMGFDLILNDSRKLEIKDAIMYLIGVENWGSGRYFPKRGDLDRALSDVPLNGFTILMSHDPSHWDLIVKEFERFVPLTLSGHTHGMQFGINLPFLKWSPVQYRYKQWMGLYQHEGRQLYVNRGFGLLGYPGRVGMSPEVTVFTLRTKA